MVFDILSVIESEQGRWKKLPFDLCTIGTADDILFRVDRDCLDKKGYVSYYIMERPSEEEVENCIQRTAFATYFRVYKDGERVIELDGATFSGSEADEIVKHWQDVNSSFDNDCTPMPGYDGIFCYQDDNSVLFFKSGYVFSGTLTTTMDDWKKYIYIK